MSLPLDYDYLDGANAYDPEQSDMLASCEQLGRQVPGLLSRAGGFPAP